MESEGYRIYLNDLHDGAHDGGRGALGVVPSGHDLVEELAALADLHDEVHGLVVLEHVPQPDHVGVLRQAAHDLHLAPDVLHVEAAPQPLLRDGLAGERLPRGRVRAAPRHPELAAAELLPQVVPPEEVSAGLGLLENGDRRAGLGRDGRAGMVDAVFVILVDRDG